MKKGAVIFWSVTALLIIGGGYFIYDKFYKKSGEGDGEDKGGNTGTGTGSGTGSGKGSSNDAPAAPSINVGDSVKAAKNGTKLFDMDFSTVKKTLDKGGFIGVVTGESTNGQFFKVTTSNMSKYYVLKNSVSKV